MRNGDHEETVIMKLPKTYEEQVEIIKKKGFVVDDDKVCESFLKQANYYRLSAYFLPFRKALLGNAVLCSNLNPAEFISLT